MIENRRILALIPARGGSKGIKRKNIVNLCGKPLISYSILAGLGSKYIDRVIVTTDSKEIAMISRQFGADVPFLRPAHLASDEAKTIDAVLHALGWLEQQKEWYDILVLLQPTQPLRTAGDIDNALAFYYGNGEKDLVSVSEVDDHPLLMRQFDKDGKMKKFLDVSSSVRRQEMERVYRVNGAIYINQIQKLNGTTSFNDNEIGFVMDKRHSVDIDELSDLALAEYYLEDGE